MRFNRSRFNRPLKRSVYYIFLRDGGRCIDFMQSETSIPSRGTRFNRSFFNRRRRSVQSKFLQDVGIGSERIYVQNTLSLKDKVRSYDDINISAHFALSDGGMGAESFYFPKELFDSGVGKDSVFVKAVVDLQDGGVGQEHIAINVHAYLTDSALGDDGIAVDVTLPLLTDKGLGQDSIHIKGVLPTLQEIGVLTDRVYEPIQADLLVDGSNVLRPLGVKVLLDSRQDLLPNLKEYTEEVPGKDGSIYFGSNYQSRMLELHVAGERKLAKYLTKDPKTLVFTRDFDKLYLVKYAGQIPLTNYPNWMEFTIPFKVVDFIRGSIERVHVGDGVLVNKGTVPTPLIIEIEDDNPAIQIGNQTLTYNGEVDGKLVIDTEKLTVELNGGNVLHNWDGGFPMLEPGETQVQGNATYRWREMWC